MIEVDKLKSLIKKHKHKIVMGGDDNQSQLVLIKREKYKKHFIIKTLETTQDENRDRRNNETQSVPTPVCKNSKHIPPKQKKFSF